MDDERRKVLSIELTLAEPGRATWYKLPEPSVGVANTTRLRGTQRWGQAYFWAVGLPGSASPAGADHRSIYLEER